MGALHRLCVIQISKLSKNLIVRSVCPLQISTALWIRNLETDKGSGETLGRGIHNYVAYGAGHLKEDQCQEWQPTKVVKQVTKQEVKNGYWSLIH